jgi:hypothetical protein
MNPDVLSIAIAEQARLLGVFSELLQKAESYRATRLTGGRKGFDRLCKRGVEILRVLRKQDPKCFDDLIFASGLTAHWAFLYAQSGTPISECARVLRTQVREAARGAPTLKATREWALFPYSFAPLKSALAEGKCYRPRRKAISGVR